MVVKIDLEKAYYRNNWNFLEVIMGHIGVGDKQIKVINNFI